MWFSNRGEFHNNDLRVRSSSIDAELVYNTFWSDSRFVDNKISSSQPGSSFTQRPNRYTAKTARFSMESCMKDSDTEDESAIAKKWQRSSSSSDTEVEVTPPPPEWHTVASESFGKGKMRGKGSKQPATTSRSASISAHWLRSCTVVSVVGEWKQVTENANWFRFHSPRAPDISSDNIGNRLLFSVEVRTLLVNSINSYTWKKKQTIKEIR